MAYAAFESCSVRMGDDRQLKRGVKASCGNLAAPTQPSSTSIPPKARVTASIITWKNDGSSRNSKNWGGKSATPPRRTVVRDATLQLKLPPNAREKPREMT